MIQQLCRETHESPLITHVFEIFHLSRLYHAHKHQSVIHYCYE